MLDKMRNYEIPTEARSCENVISIANSHCNFQRYGIEIDAYLSLART